MNKFSAAVIFSFFLTGIASAQDEQSVLTIGDDAPAIDVSHWVKVGGDGKRRGFEPLTDFEPGEVYVLEFWATWCGPCLAGMPHLSELQERYRESGVTIIGISDEPLFKVVTFLTTRQGKTENLWNDQIHYTLTTDPDKSVKSDYFTAAGQRGIPSAFLVGKDGRVEWIGHPNRLDEPLDAVVHDRWDREAFKTEWVAAQAWERDQRKVLQAVRAARADGNWDSTLKLLDTIIEKHSTVVAPKLLKFNLLITLAKKPEAGYALGYALIEENREDATLLNRLAWTVATDRNVETRDLDFALKAAKLANELTNSENASILDTLGRVYYAKDDLKMAIEVQEQAVQHAGDNRTGAQIRETLAKYKKELED